MEKNNFVPVSRLSELFKIEVSFFTELHEVGLIEITSIEESHCIHQDKICDLERMIRIHKELHINIEGIDVVLNLLQKMDALKDELTEMQNRLRIYENE